MFRARQTFSKLKQVYVKAQILNLFDLKYSIYIKTNVSNYKIDKTLI